MDSKNSNEDIKHTDTPWKLVEAYRTKLGDDKPKNRKPFYMVHTNFEEITNGPQATIATCNPLEMASQIGGNNPFRHTITKEEAKANAERIVHCVNHFDEVIEILALIENRAWRPDDSKDNDDYYLASSLILRLKSALKNTQQK